MPYWYATLSQIRSNINTTLDTENVPLLDYAAAVSERIDSELGRDLPFFLPYHLEDEEIMVSQSNVNSRTNVLSLPSYWLDIESVTQGGSVRTWDTDVFAYPPSAEPIHALRLAAWCNSWYDAACTDCNSTPVTALITGAQGYRRRGGRQWKKVGDLAANINDSVTTITVNDNSSNAITGESNRDFSAGCLFRIDDEYMFKLFTNAGNEVERGAHGTTAAAHTAGADVEVFQVEANIARITARQAGLWLARRGAYETRNSNELGTPIAYPTDMLPELWGALQNYVAL